MTKPLVLIVEDEPDLVRLLEFSLQQAGFDTVSAGDGERALLRSNERVPDLVLLDLMLPGISGTEVCRQLRSMPRTQNVPVIMLTARGEEVERVVGFELGADDFVTKPFSVRELLLRIKAILRRATPLDVTRDAVGPLRLEPDSHRAFVDGEEISLTALEFRLLTTFLNRAGRVQTREQLLREVWGMSGELQTRTVDTHVKRLREKLGSGRDLLETVRGIGYRLVDPADQ